MGKPLRWEYGGRLLCPSRPGLQLRNGEEDKNQTTHVGKRPLCRGVSEVQKEYKHRAYKKINSASRRAKDQGLRGKSFLSNSSAPRSRKKDFKRFTLLSINYKDAASIHQNRAWSSTAEMWKQTEYPSTERGAGKHDAPGCTVEHHSASERKAIPTHATTRMDLEDGVPVKCARHKGTSPV